MTKKAHVAAVTYKHEHPRFKTSKDKQWLQGRNKYVTGFCNQYQPLDAQAHEGTKPVLSDGTPRKVCPFYETCPCTCHQEIDEMYAMLGMERQPVEQAAEYVAYVDKLALETRMMLDSLERNAVLSSSAGVIAHTGNEEALGVPGNAPHGPLSDTAPGPIEPVFHSTPTGRRARGQLEYDVLKICADFAADVYEWEYCTPKNVAEEIGKMHATEPPSTGAINAVWDRWEKLGFAVQGKKPSRFVKFESDGSIQTLDMLKIRARRDKKMGKAEAKRGMLRPRGR